VSLTRRDGGEIEALITDRYLDSLLAIQPAPYLEGGPLGSDDSLGAAVRAVSRRLATDLPRFHPSFRFEERLALRLAEVAASMRLPVAAGAEGAMVPMRELRPALLEPLRGASDDKRVAATASSPASPPSATTASPDAEAKRAQAEADAARIRSARPSASRYSPTTTR